MAEISPFTILEAFSQAEILCSMSIGPDGPNDSTGEPYSHLICSSLQHFLDQMVGEAENQCGGESVVIEWQALPDLDGGGSVVGTYTMRAQIAQGPIALKNHQR